MAECEEFLEWYCSPEQEPKRTGIESRLEKILAPSDKTWRRLRERQGAARSKAFRSRIELARTKEGTLVDGFNEEDKKVRARVEKMGTNHLRRVQHCIAERRSRAREVSAEAPRSIRHPNGRRFAQGRAAWESLVSATDLRDPSAKAFCAFSLDLPGTLGVKRARALP